MVLEILKYDGYPIKELKFDSNEDYRLDGKIIENAEEKIMLYNKLIKEKKGKENLKLAVALAAIVEKYGTNILEEVGNLDIIYKEFSDGIQGKFALAPPDNQFTNEKSKMKNSQIYLGSNKDIVLLHELRHFVSSLKNSNIYLDANTLYQRTGLSQVLRIKEDNRFVFSCFGKGFDEVCNVYQSEQLKNILLRLKNIEFKNQEITNLLYETKNPYRNGYSDGAYYFTSLLLTPLLNKKDFIELTDFHAINGDYDKFENEFNYLYGDSIDFVSFVNNIDTFNSLDVQQIEQNKKGIKELKKVIIDMSRTTKKL